MATTRTIWQNTDLKIEDWKDFLEDEYPDVTDEDEQYDLIEQINNDYLSDERMNLNEVVESGKIIVIADLGLWNGRRPGYHVIQSGNIRDCLYSDCDYLHWYVDRYGDMRCTAIITMAQIVISTAKSSPESRKPSSATCVKRSIREPSPGKISLAILVSSVHTSRKSTVGKEENI